MSKPKWYVGLQKYYWMNFQREGKQVVTIEIASNGIDYSGADGIFLDWKHERALGLDMDYYDPRQAVETAIAAKPKLQEKYPQYDWEITWVGLGMGEEGENIDDETLRARAQKRFDNLEKCDQCGDVLEDDFYCCEICGNKFKLCREYCVDQHWKRIHIPDCPKCEKKLAWDEAGHHWYCPAFECDYVEEEVIIHDD